MAKLALKQHSVSEEQSVETPVLPDIDVVATLKRAGIYYIWNEITAGSLKEIHQDILLKSYLGPKRFNSPIQLVISSEGGDANEAASLIDLLANLPFKVATAGFGQVCSAAACLLACGTKGLRTIAPSATLLVHQYAWGFSGKHSDLVAHRHAQDVEHANDVEFWQKHSRYKTKKDVEKYLLKKEDNWFSAKEAVQHGIVDHVGSVLR